MKNWYIYLLCILVSSNFFACQDDDLEDQSIFDASEKEKSEFDRWLLENYVNPYNIDFKYRMEHIESDYTHNLVPTDFWLSVKLAKIVKHCWLEAYDEVGGLDFTRACAPKVIHLIGSASWDNYFKVMHHEFAHILHQKKNYPVDYDKISAGNYTPTGWQNRKLAEVAPLGFVTPYAGSKPSEDIAEVTACFLTYPEAQWENVMTLAGEKGKPIIDQKLAMVKKYMKDSWQVDLDLLRKVIARRTNEISELDLNHIY